MAAGVQEALLAKSPYGERRLTLEQHCADAEQAGAQLFREGTRWSRAWARFFRLDDVDRRRFLLNLRIAGLFHDLGKANEDFQQVVTRTGDAVRQQTLRHEHISALVLALPAVREWLAANPELDVDVITAAVLSHHMKASDSGDERFRWGFPRTPQSTLHLYLGHPQVSEILARVQEVAGLSPPPQLPTNAWSLESSWSTQVLPAGTKRARDFGRSMRRDRRRRNLLLATKAALVVADSVASGVFRVGGSIEQWIEGVVHGPALTSEEIAEKIIAARAEQISRQRGHAFEFHRFQTLAAEQGPRALLLAGCGMGKTLAAWKWAEAQARDHEVGRVIFLYPTRGTATEGFRDYVGWAPEAESALVHGTSEYELEAIMRNPPESLHGKRPQPDEQAARLFALGLWSRRFFSATVDQFLSFMEHSYGGLCLLPALADSVVIFDEVHSYDRRMFEDLLAFLSTFDVPVLCMTATLPADRREQLVSKGLRVFPDDDHREELADLEVLETRPRYRVAEVDGVDAALARAEVAFRDGKRILWVVNTVARCQEVADKIADRVREEPLVYHSRFRLCDRQDAHARTVAAFGARGGRVIAVTTQVCEMSLDLDADVLITELAPVTSLVQRFGRANRSPSRPPEDRADVLWYRPESVLPYTREALEAAARFMRALGDGEASQRRLSEALEEHAPRGVKPRETARFLDGGYYATPGSLREEDDYARSAILDTDMAQVVSLLVGRRPIDGFVVPVPKRWARDDVEDGERSSTLPRHLGIASGLHYSKTRGFIAPKGE